MKIDKNLALNIWDDFFGAETKSVKDPYGTLIMRDLYGIDDICGWELDHIRPKNSFTNEKDADFMNNLEPTSSQNNLEKSDNYPNFKVKEHEYSIVKCDICSRNNAKGYGIIDEDGNRVDAKGKRKKYYCEK